MEFNTALKYRSRYGDTYNRISIGTAAGFLAADLVKESNPYTRTTDSNGDPIVVINLHFLAEVRRHLSGVEAPNTSTFSPSEAALWNSYIDYLNDIPTGTISTDILEALDNWLVNEINMMEHPIIEREYMDSHKWNKTNEHSHEEGILWI